MGGLICCCWRMFCCECTLFEKKDNWTIEEECRPGERGAGFLYKRAKSSAMWSKRYFVIKNDKLIYYMERDRAVMKGEIVLAGTTAAVSHTRADTKKKFYFTVSHPQCGTRELCAKTRNRRQQWVDRINEVSNALYGRAVFGKLLKQGGLSKNLWQERWCVCASSTIDYFDQSTDNQSKGSINIINATINPVKIKDKFCFELTAAQPGKKGAKKYVFAAEREYDRDQWVEALKKLSTAPLAPVNPEGESNNINPVVANAHQSPHANNDDDEDDAFSSSSVANNNSNKINVERSESNASMTMRSSVIPLEMSGYLAKKSPSVMKGWQKRYFKTLPSGDIAYFKDEKEASNPNSEPKGIIRIADVVPDGIELNENTGEFSVKLQSKKVQLKASNGEDAADWARNILAWVEAKN